MQGLGSLLGVLYTSAAVGSAVGPPLAGAVIGDGGGYGTAVVCSLLVAAAATALVSRVPRPPAELTGRGQGATGTGRACAWLLSQAVAAAASIGRARW